MEVVLGVATAADQQIKSLKQQVEPLKRIVDARCAKDDDKLIAELFGSEVGAESEEVVQTIDDTADEFGYGHIIPKMVGGARKYKVEFFPRVKFTKVTSDNKTRGESVEFSTTALEGTVYPLEKEFNGMKAGTWEKHQTFATEAEAEAYLDACLTSAS